jgi:ParB family chromosome partitioning protein
VIKKGLGKGIGALIPVVEEKPLPQATALQPQRVPVAEITTNPDQPRKKFNEEHLQELAASIKEKGVLQPLLVRRTDDGYELIAGERRLRAAMKAGLETVPIVLKNVDKRERQEIALIENIQREDLNALEEAHGYQSLIEQYKYTQEDVAQRVGKSRSAVANSLRLLKLDESIKQDLLNNTITMGHARAYLALETAAQQKKLHSMVVKKGLSVRQTENYIKKLKNGKINIKLEPKASRKTCAEFDHLLEGLRKKFATKINVEGRADKGRVVIEFFSRDDFERIYEILRG